MPRRRRRQQQQRQQHQHTENDDDDNDDDRELHKLYYTPNLPSALGGVANLHREIVRQRHPHQQSPVARQSHDKTRLWLSGQDAYTLHKPIRYKF
jgi:hypothetical protein